MEPCNRPRRPGSVRLWKAFLVFVAIAWLGFAAVGVASWTPWQRLGWTTVALLGLVKLASVVLVGLKTPHRTRVDGFFGYWLLWPGVDSKPFQNDRSATAEDGRGFGAGLSCFLSGGVALIALSLASPTIPTTLIGWLGIGALLTTIHFGVGRMFPVLWRTWGRPVGNLFDRPLASRSLSEFWSRRWNLAFIEMNRLLWIPFFRTWFGRRRAVYATFLVSGLLHEAALSYSASGGYGLPTLYFLIQMAGMVAENRWRIRSWWFAWALILGPLPLLFHAPFRERCVEPLFPILYELLMRPTPSQWLSFGILALAGLQLSVLAASFQVPSRLRWREELPRLSNLNRKLVWTYGAFIALTILAFDVLTWELREELAAGDRSARYLAGFAAIFWTVRLAFDKLWLKHEDWPPGPSMAIGHALLTALFFALTLGYGFLAIRPVG